MNDQFVATVLLYLVPLFALLVTWKKPLSKALGWIAASEILGLLLFLPLYALVGLLGWEWYSWGGVSLQEILAYWQESGLTALAWILPGLGETALLFLLRWGLDTLRLAGMAAAALLLVALAWFLLPAPLVNNAAQTELLSIQVVGAGRKTQCWKPQSMVDRQTARAIVDRMAHLHKQYTFQTASQAVQGQPALTLFFRTEEHYQMVALYRQGGQWQGIACTQDKPNPLTAQVSQPGELLRYVTDLLPNQLDGMGETG